VPGIEPGTVVRNSDHKTTEAVLKENTIIIRVFSYLKMVKVFRSSPELRNEIILLRKYMKFFRNKAFFSPF
jgi:hypothetical protein